MHRKGETRKLGPFADLQQITQLQLPSGRQHYVRMYVRHAVVTPAALEISTG
jgi:hypothetical protein